MAKKDTTKTPKDSATTSKKSKGFTAEEKAAMKERNKELKAEAEKADGESSLLAKLAEMPEHDRIMGERIHAIVKTVAPSLSPKLWYGQPSYANKEGKVVCFFQPASKFGTRYATLGFNDVASLDEGEMWPVAFALKDLNESEEAKITALVKKAVS